VGSARARSLTAAEGVARSLAVVFDQPIAAALVLGMLSAFWIYADEPARPGSSRRSARSRRCC